MSERKKRRVLKRKWRTIAIKKGGTEREKERGDEEEVRE